MQSGDQLAEKTLFVSTASSAPSDIHSLAYLPRGRDHSNPHLLEITNQASYSPLISPFTTAPNPKTCSIFQNLTAGMAACLSAFPASLRPAPQMKDAIQSCVDINEPFGLGLMLASLHSGQWSRLDGLVRHITRD